MNIAITMTATYRPEIIIKTLQTFSDNLFRADLSISNLKIKLIVNLDKIGECNFVSTEDIHSIFSHYFDVTVFDAKTPHFGLAFHRVWSQIAEHSDIDFVFHLEDDWELLQPVRLSQLLAIMYEYPELAMLRLSTTPSGNSTMKQWGHEFQWNGHFFVIPKENRAKLRVAGHPAIIRPCFIREVLPYIDPEKNPEKQISEHRPEIAAIMDSYIFGVFNYTNSDPLIRDLGRQWMIKENFSKKGNKAWFIEWEHIKKEE